MKNWKRKNKKRTIKPLRRQLSGYSASEFKTLLKLNGHKIKRDFYKNCCISIKAGRYWRWRWWGENGFVVDVSCKVFNFDKWSNSIEETRKVAIKNCKDIF